MGTADGKAARELVIAEKPELARDIACAVAGAPENARLPYSLGRWTVCSCAGHLLRLKEPADVDGKWAAPWRLEALPVLIPSWPLEPEPGKEALLARIGRLLKRADRVWHAGDPDDEGQLIVDEVLEWFGWEGPTLRVHVNDSVPENILAAFRAARPNAAFAGESRGARARAVADKCFGVNESRLASIRAGRLVPVGRVQTPALAMVVERDRAVESHEARPVYHVEALALVDGGGPHPFRLRPRAAGGDGKGRFARREAAEAALAEALGHRGRARTEARRRTSPPPLPYNLTALVSEMSRRHGMTAERTAAAAQALRLERRAITYSRTDCRHLKPEHLEQAPGVLRCARESLGAAWDLDLGRPSGAFDASRVSAHHAIIPQRRRVDPSSLPEDQRLVYEAVCERYAMQFMGPCEREVSTTAAELPCGTLEAVYARVVEGGWRAQLGGTCPPDPLDSRAGGWIEPGDHAIEVVSARLAEGETSPPRRFTDGSLVSAMASAASRVADPALRAALLSKDEGKDGERGGIGTPATRDEAIARLVSRGLLERRASGALVSTALGRELVDAAPDEAKSVETTARWWLAQREAAEGRASADDLQRMVAAAFESHAERGYEGLSRAGGRARPPVGRCPACGAEARLDGRRAECSREGCGFWLWTRVAGKDLTEAQVRDLLSKGRTRRLKGFRRRDGSAIEAPCRVVLDPATLRARLDFGG